MLEAESQEQGKDPYESSATYIEDPLLFLTANTYHPKLKAVLWTGIVMMPIRTLANVLHILENFKKIFLLFHCNANLYFNVTLG